MRSEKCAGCPHSLHVAASLRTESARGTSCRSAPNGWDDAAARQGPRTRRESGEREGGKEQTESFRERGRERERAGACTHLAAEVPVEAGDDDVLPVDVGGEPAELQQVGQELRLVHPDDLRPAVALRPHGPLQLRQPPHRVALPAQARVAHLRARSVPVQVSNWAVDGRSDGRNPRLTTRSTA